jgi:hypothetical protein
MRAAIACVVLLLVVGGCCGDYNAWSSWDTPEFRQQQQVTHQNNEIRDMRRQMEEMQANTPPTRWR